MPAHDPECLRAFRTALHDCFHRRADALFVLSDALLAAASVTSLSHVSLPAAHRRGWGSLYDALAEGHLDVAALRTLLTRHVASDEHPVYPIDQSVWPRCDAEASPDRGLYSHPSRHSAGQPIVAGWAYQGLARLSFTRDSWTTPRDVPRVHPSQNANAVAMAQITPRLSQLPRGGAPPLFVCDAGSDAAHVTHGLAHLPGAVLVRLRADRGFDADPPSAPPSPKGGRPRKHGAKFACQEPSPWPSPTAEQGVEDAQYGTMRVRAWAGQHPKQPAHPGRGTRQPRSIVRGPVVLVDVSRLPARPPRRRHSDCGGPERGRRTWTCSGAPTSGASPWSTRCALATKALAGQRRACGIRSKPIAGRGSSWPPTPSCG
jgi:hypothetical protein